MCCDGSVQLTDCSRYGRSAVRQEFVFVTKAPCEADAGQTSMASRGEVYLRVTNIDAMLGLSPQLRHGQVYAIGRRLACYALAFADGKGHTLGKVLGMELLGSFVHLIRNDGHGIALGLERSQEVEHASIRCGASLTMGGVVCAEGVEEGGVLLRRKVGWLTQAHKLLYAIAQGCTHLLACAEWVAIGGHSVVDTIKQRGERVEEGTVEVEDEGGLHANVLRGCGHGGRHG